jgi:hypothetical protein
MDRPALTTLPPSGFFGALIVKGFCQIATQLDEGLSIVGDTGDFLQILFV